MAGTLADGFGNHRHNNRRGGRRLSNRNRAGRNRAFRRGRTEDLGAADAALGAYGAADTTAAPEVLPPPADYPDYGADYGADYEAAPAPASYGAAAEGALGQYAADDAAAADPNLAMLEKAVPGIPGEDYPIYSEVPESAFTCDGQVDGGKKNLISLVSYRSLLLTLKSPGIHASVFLFFPCQLRLLC